MIRKDLPLAPHCHLKPELTRTRANTPANRQAPLQAYPKTATPAETPNIDNFKVSQLSANNQLPLTLKLAIDPRLITGPHAARLKTDKNYSYYPTPATMHYRDYAQFVYIKSRIDGSTLVNLEGQLGEEDSYMPPDDPTDFYCSACSNNCIKVELCSLDYDPAACTVLLPGFIRPRADMPAT